MPLALPRVTGGVPLEFPHDGSGHVRALRKLTLTAAELAGAVADSPGNRSRTSTKDTGSGRTSKAGLPSSASAHTPS
ncbi:MAG TPA: hypothetical protein VHZ03_20950 [Trebonia sp.]|jgi:hypothetical protein|nr:hypothetical protein [Trebonia sp.]